MPTTITAPRSGRSVELGRYRVEDADRVLVGRRIEGEVFVYDYPLGPGRPYFVERGFESMRELSMLVADYRRQAAQLGACPMSCEGIGRSLLHAAT
jgi:hypothetical protein